MEEQKATVNTCLSLIEQGNFDQAQNLLESLSNSVAYYLNGKILIHKAETIVRSLGVRACLSDDERATLRSYIIRAQIHFAQSCFSLMSETRQVVDFVRHHLMDDLGRIESMYAYARNPMAIGAPESADDDLSKMGVASVTSLLDKLNLK